MNGGRLNDGNCNKLLNSFQTKTRYLISATGVEANRVCTCSAAQSLIETI